MQALFCGHVQRGRAVDRAQHGALYSHMHYNGAISPSKAFYMQGIKVYGQGIASRLQGFTGLLWRICGIIGNQQLLFASFCHVPGLVWVRIEPGPGGLQEAAAHSIISLSKFLIKKDLIYNILSLSPLFLLLLFPSFPFVCLTRIQLLPYCHFKISRENKKGFHGFIRKSLLVGKISNYDCQYLYCTTIPL